MQSTSVLSRSVVLLASVICLFGCAAEKEKPAPPPPGVTITPVIQKDVPVRQEWVGNMTGNVDADIRPKVDGFLLSRTYQEGSLVQKGQAMFQLDSRQTQASQDQAAANLERAKASLNQAQIDVDRYTPLVAQHAVSQAELDKAISMQRAAKALVDADQAVLDNAKLNIGWTTVRAPITGIAGLSKVAIGDLMTPSTVMTTISNVNPIYVDVNITEQDYLRFRRDKTSSNSSALQLVLGDGTVYPQRGRVLFLGREVDARTGTIQVRAEFANPGNVLRPGQYARLVATTEVRKGAMLVPQAAVNELQGIYQVGVVSSDNKVEIRTVKLGPQFGNMWVVDSGLNPGDNVIVEGLQRVRTGMVVNPSPFKNTESAVGGEI